MRLESTVLDPVLPEASVRRYQRADTRRTKEPWRNTVSLTKML